MSKPLIEVFKALPDPRQGNGIRHKLDEILTIAILAIICECTQFTEMEVYGKENEDWLRTFLKLENGIPSHDTFGDVFALLAPEIIEKHFMEWVEGIREKISGEIIAVDGKTICGSKNIANKKKAIHVVSAWAANNRLVLGEVATDKKSNEITAIPELLRMLSIKGCIITIDAMGTQKEIVKTVIEQGADYVLPVKENHPTLHTDLELFFLFEDNHDYAKTTEKAHGRIEVRECFVSNDVDWLPNRGDWAGLSGIGKIVSYRENLSTGKKETSVQYIIYSDANMTASQVLDAKRSHWGVENSLHWVLDVTFGEDQSRMRLGNAAKNVSAMRHMAVNLLNNEKTYKASVNLKRKRATFSRQYLLKLIGVGNNTNLS